MPSSLPRRPQRGAREILRRLVGRLCELVVANRDRLIERYGCESVRVRASKPEPPLPLAIQEVAVEITQERAVDDAGED